jgi:ribosome-associated protein
LSDPESTPGPTPESELLAEQIERARQIVEAALEVKAERPVALNVREVTSFADVLIILSGRSDRQVRGIVDAIRVALRAQGEKPLAIEGYGEGRWVLIDLSDVIVHVFTPEVRERYDIERLWSDAKPIDLAIEELEDASAGTVP